MFRLPPTRERFILPHWFMPSAAGLPFVIIIVVVKSSETNNKVYGMRQKQKQTLNSNGFLLPTDRVYLHLCFGLGKISCLHAAVLCLLIEGRRVGGTGKASQSGEALADNLSIFVQFDRIPFSNSHFGRSLVWWWRIRELFWELYLNYST